MPINSLLLAAVAALALGAGGAPETNAAVAGVVGKLGPSAPQVAYPPICRWDPLFPRYCRRW